MMTMMGSVDHQYMLTKLTIMCVELLCNSMSCDANECTDSTLLVQLTPQCDVQRSQFLNLDKNIGAQSMG